MKKRIFYAVLMVLGIGFLNGCRATQREVYVPNGFVLVEGGYFANPNSNLYETDVFVFDFLIGKQEVTQAEWLAVMGDNPSQILGEMRPVETISWYDAILFANKKSVQHELEPVYIIEKEGDETSGWHVMVNELANGFRLPTEVEWEFAASGGLFSQHYLYSGSNDVNAVAWYFRNSGDYFLEGMWDWAMIEANNASTHEVGQKLPNELGLYDMSGNVREWIWDWFSETEINPDWGEQRVIRGGGWVGSPVPTRIYERRYMPPSYKFYDLGLRLVRSIN